jgi:hypothetical protein
MTSAVALEDTGVIQEGTGHSAATILLDAELTSALAAIDPHTSSRDPSHSWSCRHCHQEQTRHFSGRIHGLVTWWPRKPNAT